MTTALDSGDPNDVSGLLRRGRLAIATLALCALVDVFDAVSMLMQIELLTGVQYGHALSEADAEANDARVQMISIANIASLVACAVFFTRWFHLAFRTAYGLGVQGLTRTAKEAATSFFIPVVAMFRPYQAMKELHDALDPEGVPEPLPVPTNDPVHYREGGLAIPTSRIPTPDAPLGPWWAFWIGGGLVGNAAARMNGTSIPALLKSSCIGLISDVLLVVAAVLAIAVVRSIDARMRERSRRMSGASVAQHPAMAAAPAA